MRIRYTIEFESAVTCVDSWPTLNDLGEAITSDVSRYVKSGTTPSVRIEAISGSTVKSTTPKLEAATVLPHAKEGTVREKIKPGMDVSIVLKKDQPTGILTRGVVRQILTHKSYHPRGIKVMLTDGQVGRVQKIHTQHECGNGLPPLQTI